MRAPIHGRLSTRIGLAAAAVALVTGIVISLAGYFAVKHQERKAREDLAAQHVRQQALRIADRLDVMTSSLRVAVGSSLMASALVDSAGKELYVQPFLNRLSAYPGVSVSVYFVDYEGEVSMQSDGALPLTAVKAWVARTVVAGREGLHLMQAADGGGLYYVAPLIYARTGRPEGALVAQVRLRDLVIAEGANLVIAEAAEPVASPYQDATVPLDARLIEPAARLVWRDHELVGEIDESFSSRSSQVLVLGLALSLAAALLLSRPVARSALRDVDRLVAELEALGAHPDTQRSRIGDFGSEEIRRIAKAVNATLETLEHSNKGYQREREMRMAGIIESATDAIITLDADHRIVQFNAAAALMFRIPAEEAMGGTVERFVPIGQRTGHDAMIRTFATSGAVPSRRMGRARSFSASRLDGELFQAEATLTKARIDGQDYMTVLIRDISDQVMAEGERAARALAEAANKEKTAFLARMSHELRTPLNAIYGFAELLLKQQHTISHAERQHRLTLIIDSSRRLLSLINDLLDVSRIELGELGVQVSAIDVTAVVRSATTELEDLARRSGVDIRLHEPVDPLWALGDPARLHQVMSNLMSNAIKYNRPGGSVDIRLGHRGDQLTLAVHDTGLGMQAEQLAALYQPFNRLGRDNQAQGTGIGLTITKHLVEAMGGAIEVHSVPDEGSCFTVLLAACQAPIRDESGIEVEGSIALRDEVVGRLLYVEDNPINQVLMSSCMELRPAVTFSVAEDGRAALEAVVRYPPDLMLVDMMLPDMHGIELGLKLRELLGEQCPTLIAYSANALPEDIAAARAAGFAQYLVKPTPADELFAVLDRLLGESRAASRHG